jgi:hypothetical protein
LETKCLRKGVTGRVLATMWLGEEAMEMFSVKRIGKEMMEKKLRGR